MSFAELVAKEITQHPHTACTLQGGYMVLHNGDRRMFHTGRIIHQVRNRDGRCTHAVCEYADGSQLRFEWSESGGPRYTVVEKG